MLSSYLALVYKDTRIVVETLPSVTGLEDKDNKGPTRSSILYNGSLSLDRLAEENG